MTAPLALHAIGSADRSIVASLHRFGLVHPAWTRAMRVITEIGAPLTWWILLAATVGCLVAARRYRLAGWATVCVVGGFVINTTVKIVVGRDRPTFVEPLATASGKAFPSGHAEMATAAALVLLAVLRPRIPRRRRWMVYSAGAVVVAAIAFSRVALGVHYPSDVLGGIVLGAVWVGVITALMWPRDTDGRRALVARGRTGRV